jgi:hypothetical protein
MAVRLHGSFESIDHVRISWCERLRPPEVIQGAAVVAGAPVGAGKGAEQVSVLARMLFRFEQHPEGFPPSVSSRQCGAETNARVDI